MTLILILWVAVAIPVSIFIGNLLHESGRKRRKQ